MNSPSVCGDSVPKFPIRLRSIFCCSVAVNEYVDAVRRLACRVLDLLGEGLGLGDPTSLSRFVSAVDSDSVLRINHYPTSSAAADVSAKGIGFGEHTDPQILSLLRANDVDGLQVLLPDARGGSGGDQWVQVPADPSAFFINVGDALQVGEICCTILYCFL